MFVLRADKNKLAVSQRESVTSGSVNIYSARFEFSPDWQGLATKAVFKGSGTTKTVLLDGGECVIPWEVLTSHGQPLMAGVFGTLDDTVLPTIWAGLGTVLEGVPTDGEGAKPPTPDLWEQELGRKGDTLAYDGLNLTLKSGGKPLSAVQISGGGSTGGVPIGTVISYMGTAAPEGYLVCDGGVHPISQYGDLAALFQAQFGAANCFGGDGETTFAVPDLRNLFLRGYHGEAEALSGAIGRRQNGTVHTAIHGIQAENGNYAIWTASRGQLSGDLSMHTENADAEGTQEEAMCGGAALVGQGRETSAATYTARPVNAAVLYCIKAERSA